MLRRSVVGLFIVIVIVFVSGTNGLAAGGRITGKVGLTGTAPPPKKIAIAKDPSVCGTEKQLEEVQLSPDKGVLYAVGRLLWAKGAAPPPAAAVIDQKGCMFNPVVVVVSPGGNLDITNSDGILHNVHSHSTVNRPINRSQPGFLKKLTAKFDRAETIRLSCDIHGWMTGWVVVAEEPFVAVTDGSGAFQLADVPAGTYKLEVWQPAPGTQTRDVTVTDGAEAKVNFELAVK